MKNPGNSPVQKRFGAHFLAWYGEKAPPRNWIQYTIVDKLLADSFTKLFFTLGCSKNSPVKAEIPALEQVMNDTAKMYFLYSENFNISAFHAPFYQTQLAFCY
jgi:hypothetical protein